MAQQKFLYLLKPGIILLKNYKKYNKHVVGHPISSVTKIKIRIEVQ